MFALVTGSQARSRSSEAHWIGQSAVPSPPAEAALAACHPLEEEFMRIIVIAITLALSAGALAPVAAANSSNIAGSYPDWAKKAFMPRGK
jgi:hypothetical protein